mmetsp:Transcript_9993/g.27220  ORF Transcript_9993/g.27220 Transcript_9993/m.27220 type:complete len:238 (+) Transcript_9993:1196-1909(+)
MSARSERPAPSPSTRATRSERNRGRVLFATSRCSARHSCCRSPCSRTSSRSLSKDFSRVRSLSDSAFSASLTARCRLSSTAATCCSTSADRPVRACCWLSCPHCSAATAFWRSLDSAFCALACSPSSRWNSERSSEERSPRSWSGRLPQRSSTACRRSRTRLLSSTSGSSCCCAFCSRPTSALCALVTLPSAPASSPSPAWTASTGPVTTLRSRHSSLSGRNGMMATAMLVGRDGRA